MKNSFKEIIFSLEWYDSRIHKGVMTYASEHNWLVYSNANNMAVPTNITPDGMLVSITSNEKFYQWVKEKKNKDKIPCIGLSAELFELDIPKVVPDYYAIGKSVANFFSERKFQNYACLFPHPNKPAPWIQERIDGFADTVNKINGNLFLRYRKIEDANRSITKENKLKIEWFCNQLSKLTLPCAIFITSDDIAPLLQIACMDSKILIPEDVAIIGVDNKPMICPYTPVPLSSVDPGWENLGHKAATMLDRLMKGENLSNNTVKIPPVGIQERQSSSIVAVKDRNVSMAVSYISKHLKENPTVEKICNAIRVPRRKLERAFRKHLKRSIKQELNIARIREVQQLLLKTDLPAVEISKRLNFNNEFQMYKIFKKHTSMTTKQFRQKSKKN